MALNELTSSLKAINPKINDWAVEAIKLNKVAILAFVKNSQLSRGLNSLGSPLAFYDERDGTNGDGFYAESTQSYADADGIGKKKTQGDAYSFDWSGKTLAGIYLQNIDKSNSTYTIFSKATKAKLLKNLYGEIFDLTDEHNNYINEFIIKQHIFMKLDQELNKIAQRLF